MLRVTIEAETANDLVDLLEKLRGRDRWGPEALADHHLQSVDGHSVRTAAEQLGISKSVVHRARQRRNGIGRTDSSVQSERARQRILQKLGETERPLTRNEVLADGGSPHVLQSLVRAGLIVAHGNTSNRHFTLPDNPYNGS